MPRKPGTPRHRSNEARNKAGATVTFRNADGELLTIHRSGQHGLAECLAVALTVDPTYRVQTISNPRTILQDLIGRRPGGTGVPGYTGRILAPEHYALGIIGRKDMLP